MAELPVLIRDQNCMSVIKTEGQKIRIEGNYNI